MTMKVVVDVGDVVGSVKVLWNFDWVIRNIRFLCDQNLDQGHIKTYLQNSFSFEKGILLLSRIQDRFFSFEFISTITRVSLIILKFKQMKAAYLGIILLFATLTTTYHDPHLHIEEDNISYNTNQNQLQSTPHRLLQKAGEQLQQFPDTPELSNSGDNSDMKFGTFQSPESKANTPNQPSRPQAQTTNSGAQGTTQQPNRQQPNSQQTNQPNSQGLTPAKRTQPAPQHKPKILQTEIGKPVLGKSFKIDNGISYQRLLVDKLLMKYLFIDFKLAQSDKWQQAKVTVSIDGTEQIVTECQYSGYDSCYIPSTQLRPNQTLFLTIKCQDQCRYMLNSQWSDLEHLIPGAEMIFKFGKETIQLYHVELDPAVQFKEFRVHVATRVTQRPFDNVKIYGKFGKNSNPTPKDYTFTSINLWQDGEGLFLKRKNIENHNFTLLLVGQPDTTYKLTCQLITKQNHQIQDGQHIYEYLEASDSKTYHIESFDTKNNEEFSLRISVLSGYAKIRYFYDKELSKELPIEPFKYMDDSEYIFDSQQVAQLASTGIYIKVTSVAEEVGQSPRDVTYTIKYLSRKKSEGVELSEHVYGFIPMKDTRFAFFNFKRWIFETEKATSLRFTTYLMNVLGKSKAEFFLCNSPNLRHCTNPELYKNTTTPIQIVSHDIVGQKIDYVLQIEDSTLRKVNTVEKEGNIVIKITTVEKAKEAQGFNLVALEILNNNKVMYIREDRPLEEKLSPGEIKVYKYINSDPSVKEIRVHINQIAGIVKADGLIKNNDDRQPIMVRPEGHTLRFTKNLTNPIIVTIRADTKAIFGISMQVILKNEMHPDADVIAIGEDLTYKFRINPQSYIIFQISPMYYQFAFKYSSSQSVVACAMNPTTGMCINATDASTRPRLNYEGVINKAQLSDRKARVKITNPFIESIAEVTVIFHSRNFNHCDSKEIGTVYSENVNNGTCYSYRIQEQQETGLEIYISKRQFANMRYSVFICGNSIADAQKVKTLSLNPDVIKKHCSNNIEEKKLDIQWQVNTKNANSVDRSVKVDFVVQRLGGVVMLPEGLSYSIIGKSREGVLKTFGYSLINKQQTRIYIHQIIGKFRVFAKVIKEQDRNIEKISQIDYQLTGSNNIDFSQDPVIVVTKKHMQGKCITCSILIAVYSLQKPGRTIQFQIEVVQKYETLVDDGSVNGYLEAGSTSYYKYIAKPGQSTLIFFLSDHNQRCANMFLSASENPSEKNQIMAAFETNELIFSHRANDNVRYYLAVQAVKTCDYALSVLQLDSSIHRLERGRQNMIKLLKGEKRFFTFEQYTNEPFKIISLSMFGQVKLYLNRSSEPPNKRTWTVEELDVSKFELTSQNTNTLAVGTKDPVYCTNCDYFVAAEAQSITFSTLYLVYPDTVVPLLRNKFFSDFIENKNQHTYASYNNIEKSQLKVTVHSGQLEITASFKEYFSDSRKFKAQSAVQTMIIDTNVNNPQKNKSPQKTDSNTNSIQKNKQPFQEHIPINFIFKALKSKTSYTIQIKRMIKKGEVAGFAEYQNIMAGEPNHVTIKNTEILCIDGFLRQINESILITTNSDNSPLLKQLILDAKLRGNKTVVSSKIIKNMVSLNFDNPNSDPNITVPYKSNNYEICMKLDHKFNKQQDEDQISETNKQEIVKDKTQNQTQTEKQFQDKEEIQVKAVVTQINSVNIIPSDTDSIVRGDAIFVIHSDGEFIFDVFECSGSAKISYGDSLATLKNQDGKSLEIAGISQQKHAVKVSQKDVTFLKVKSPHAIVRWLPLNFETDEGTGYLRFEAGDLRYNSKFKNMVIEFQPIQTVKKTKSTVGNIKYTIYISNSSEKMDYAMQCQSGSNKDVLTVPLNEIKFNTIREEQRNYESYDIDKNLLNAKFNGSENIYVDVIAQMEVKLSSKLQKNPRFTSPSTDEHEHYRFVYNRQQMPLQSYKPTQIEEMSYLYLALIFLGAVTILVLGTCLFTRKIVPMIARLRTSTLVQEPDDVAARDDLEVVPPSSDRNQRAADLQVETEEKMG